MSFIASLSTKIQELSRVGLLKTTAASIEDLTTLGRFYFNEPNELSKLRHINEAIRRLSGHLRDLCDPSEPCTESRAQGICEQLEILPEASLKRIYEFTA